jgi:hypothetical protein
MSSIASGGGLLPASCIGPFGKLRAGTSRKERAQDDSKKLIVK